MTDWEYTEEFYNDEWISPLRNPSLRGNLMCLILWFLDMKQEQGWEVVSSSPHVLHDKTGIRSGVVVIFKRKKLMHGQAESKLSASQQPISY